MEIPQSDTQQPHCCLTLIAARPELFRRQGSVAEIWRTRGGKRFGPYCRLMYWEQGRRRSVYLGRPGPLVEQVRRALAKVQAPRRRDRMYRRLRRDSMAALRLEKARLGAILQAYGLRMQGFEVRGWRGVSGIRGY